jgi:hypothetical protein
VIGIRPSITRLLAASLMPLVGSRASSAESARQDFDQRRFASTVLAKKRTHLSRFQRRRAIERFTDFFQSKQ